MKRTLLALAITSTFALTACGGSTSSSETTTSSAASEPKVTATCSKQEEISDPDLAAAVASVNLPSGAIVTSVRLNRDAKDSDKKVVAIDTCNPAIKTPDDLRPIASEYARALRASPLSDSLSTVYVSSIQWDGKTPVNEVKHKDPSFRIHLWDGKALAGVENGQWDVVTGG